MRRLLTEFLHGPERLPTFSPQLVEIEQELVLLLGAVLGAAAPGQLPYAAVGMLGLLLPKSTARLLVRSR